uniref:NADH:ubiquinone reductase (H(+)-translocating) n=1 Tax=Platygaster sp. ZJUH_2016026 TaxID=2491166 RepID=A0A3S8V162_9HYME|nr:NADH dehydrogenase subunit 5 [Platygaster sp. ZJUH_2016026]
MYAYLYMNMSLFLFLMFMMLMLLMFKFIIFKLSYFLEFILLDYMGMKSSVIIYLDYKSLLFIMLVLLISSMILMYSVEYMLMDLYKIRFLIILSMFILSMILMIIGQNLLIILLGWDGLGLISYCLIIYYNSWSSFNSGMLTLLTNRLGDIGLLLSISLMSLLGSWNYLLYSYYSMLLFMMLMMAIMTKSAQVPFSSWLPAAMAAPTPVSSLVHSSTLVTAGIYLLMRFYNFMMKNIMLKKVLMFIGVLTMFMAGMIANMENDFKKIIALSTLSQLGLMLMSLCLSLKMLSYFHLVIHALFKSLLFMCSGLILHSMLDNQDLRMMGGLNLNYYLTLMYFNCANLALCGYPFLSGFFSKDMILELLLVKNSLLLIMVILYISIGLTVMYTFRLLFYMNMMYMKYNKFMEMKDNYYMNMSMIILFLNSLFIGMFMSKLLFNMMMFMFLSLMMKIFVIIMMMIGMMLGMMINYIINKYYLKINLLIFILLFMKYMYGLSKFLVFMKKLIFYMKNMNSWLEKGWVNFYSIELLLLIYKNIFFFYLYINIINLLILLLGLFFLI